MNLTSHMKSTSSPLRGWLVEPFPNTSPVAAATNRRIVHVPRERAAGDCPVPCLPGADRALAGIAADYLLRACLQPERSTTPSRAAERCAWISSGASRAAQVRWSARRSLGSGRCARASVRWMMRAGRSSAGAAWCLAGSSSGAAPRPRPGPMFCARSCRPAAASTRWRRRWSANRASRTSSCRQSGPRRPRRASRHRSVRLEPDVHAERRDRRVSIRSAVDRLTAAGVIALNIRASAGGGGGAGVSLAGVVIK
jgi:hypothetical protein